ncbi:MAG TPA: TadE/TadG family type IV pilus assembly protein [Gemmatimonadaceae bacterium]|nr:TadE/TadG family type IV pilus assembly protein [Gemmatimonadaceae bacterium]
MAEFALVSVVFMALLFGVFEFGIAAFQVNSVASDAREGARYAVVRGTNSGRVATRDSVENFIKARTALSPSRVRVYVTWTPDKRPGSLVTVSVAHTVSRRGLVVPARTDSATSKMYIYN